VVARDDPVVAHDGAVVVREAAKVVRRDPELVADEARLSRSDERVAAYDPVVVGDELRVVDEGRMVIRYEAMVADGVGVVVDGDTVAKMGVPWVAHDANARADPSSTCARRVSTRIGDDRRGAVVSYSLAALSKRTGVTVYRIRHYVQAGIVPPARRAGSTSVFDEDHVERLAVIEQLRARRVGIAAIRQHVRTLDARQLRVLAGLEAEPVDEPEPVVVAKPPKGARELRDSVDALLCVAAEALDVSPKALRPAFATVFARMHESELTAAEVVSVLGGAREGA